MVSYQDYLKVVDGEDKIPVIDFVKSTIAKHKDSAIYQTALVADEYNRKLNRTITQYQKLLYAASGQVVPDMYASNYKLRSNFFNRFVTQQNQFLLGNGVKWGNEDTAKKLGGDFDSKLQDAGEKALVHAVSFGFWNMDHLQVFSLLEFCPLWDEEDGSMKAGIRFWQIDDQHQLRARGEQSLQKRRLAVRKSHGRRRRDIHDRPDRAERQLRRRDRAGALYGLLFPVIRD